MNKQKTALLLSLILLIACLASCSILYIRYYNTSENYIACIYQNGTLIQSIDLGKVTSEYSVTITSQDGSYNRVLVSCGSVSICEASCPDQICVRQGKVQNDLLPITCLPNHVVIKLHPAHYSDSENLPDAIAY